MVKIKEIPIIRFIGSVTLATLVWVYVANGLNPIQTKTISSVPVTVLNADSLVAQNLAVDSSNIEHINVNIEGRYSDIQNFSADDILATVDVKDLALKEGDNNLLLSLKSLKPNVRVLDNPSTAQVKVNISQLLQKEFPLIITATGTLPDGYINGESELSKEKIIVTGTKEQLDDIKHVSANVDIDNATQDINTTVELQAINKLGKEATDVSLKDKELTVNIPIYYSKEVPIELDIKKGTPLRKTLSDYSLSTSSVTIIGDKASIDKINSIRTEAVDLSRRYYDFEKTLALVIPNGIQTKDDVRSTYVSFIIK